MTTKKLNPNALSFIWNVARIRLKRELPKAFAELPEDPNGIPIKFSDVEAKVDTLFSMGEQFIEELMGQILPDPVDPAAFKEVGVFEGRDSDGRPMWKFSHLMGYYPEDFAIVIPNYRIIIVENHDGLKFEDSGVSVIHPDDSGMEISVPKDCQSEDCHIVYNASEVDELAVITPPAPELDYMNPESYDHHDTYSELRYVAGKMFTWMNGRCENYGPRILFEFPDTNTMWLIEDPCVTHGADGNPKNHNQMFYFCGTDFEPHESENNNWMPSIFSKPGKADTKVIVHY